MSIVAVHGPHTFGSQALNQNATISATTQGANGLDWTLTARDPLLDEGVYSWDFEGGDPATGTGPGPHDVTFTEGAQTVTLTFTPDDEEADPVVTTLTVNAAAGGVRMMPGVTNAQVKKGAAAADPDTPDDVKFTPVTEQEDTVFDPEEHTVEEVVAYAEGSPDDRKELERLLKAEKKGKDRSTLTAKLESLLEEQK